ncbi:MAG: hypothetical protein ABIQ44_14310, partial [Chloroflexia bacterium]
PTATPVPPTATINAEATATPLSLGNAQDLPALTPGVLGASAELPVSGGPRAGIGAAAATLGAPSWVKAGSRIVYYQAAASVAQSNFAWVEDPEGPWEDPKTGKKYRRTDESGENMGDGGGDGLSVIDVLAIEGSNVVLAWNLYGIDHISNQYVPGGGGGAKVNGALIDGLWTNPTQFEIIEEAAQDNILVLRGKYEMGGVKYDAISFANTTPDAYSSYTYDLKTGLLLAATSNTTGPPSSGGTRGNAYLTVTRFAGTRLRSVPGLTGKNPDWVARTTKMQYVGQYNFTNPMDPSSASYTFPLNNVVALTKGGKNWSSFSNVITVQAQGLQPIKGNGITGSAGFYWIDPAALKSLKKGQQLDKDPVTGEIMAVKSVGTQGGTKIVVVTDQMPGFATEVTYDQTTGALLGYVSNIAMSGITVQAQLKQRP